ncbi:type II toxin-antitoxin system ParD family antitoxin [Oleomonas cavernae]|uniref:Type II toxin-antitoxin system ParD family antitoxin n=1 Tax=Oleomonas cavernae TaxID=2320859 RepID=A0A418WDQ7_9PROT|nr:type II toxin-antitoxin system ParD family antitoxin [Oleomonas cavernae]RJF88124.1 type II toxin-antitoxin system ParD family antitoxin [Oleomonas cavernae]
MYSIGKEFEPFVERQLAAGRHGTVTDLVHAALRLLEDHERRFAVLDEAVVQGMGDAAAGSVEALDPACEALLAELAAMPAAKAAP